MKEYNCDTCGKIFFQNIDLIRHKSRKKPCEFKILNILKNPSNLKDKPAKLQDKPAKLKEDIIIKKKNKLSCDFCGKKFTRKDNLDSHVKLRCKEKQQKMNNEKEEIFQKLLKQMMEQNKKLDNLQKQNEIIIEENQELKNKMHKLENKTKNINKCTINNSNNINNTIDKSNNINNNTINIQLVAYGKEDYDKLTDKEYQIIINKGYKSIQEMVKSLHFNKNRPENHNIYISNIRDNYVMIYDGNKWELRNRKETIEELYIAKKDILVDKFDELLKKLPEYVIDKFERFINDEQDDKIKEGILEELKLILYNNKNIPLKTKERLGLLK